LDLNTCRGNEAKIKQKTKIKNDLKSYDVNNCQISRVKKKKEIYDIQNAFEDVKCQNTS